MKGVKPFKALTFFFFFSEAITLTPQKELYLEFPNTLNGKCSLGTFNKASTS